MLTTLTRALRKSESHAERKGQSALISVDCSLQGTLAQLSTESTVHSQQVTLTQMGKMGNEHASAVQYVLL